MTELEIALNSKLSRSEKKEMFYKDTLRFLMANRSKEGVKNMIVLILGLAGSGKTTICRLLQKDFKVITIYTTRKRRIDDGTNYIFINEKDFSSLYKQNEILTKARIGNDLYGLKNELAECKINIAVSDIFTLRQLRRKKIKCVAMYLDVPIEECERRLVLRGDDSMQISKKLALGKKWCEKEKNQCSYTIMSGSVDEEYKQVLCILHRLYD